MFFKFGVLEEWAVMTQEWPTLYYVNESYTIIKLIWAIFTYNQINLLYYIIPFTWRLIR